MSAEETLFNENSFRTHLEINTKFPNIVLSKLNVNKTEFRCQEIFLALQESLLLMLIFLYFNYQNSGRYQPPVFYLGHDDSETGFCPRLQVKPTLDLIERASLCLRTPASQRQSQSYISTDSQSVLVSGTHLVPATNFSFSLKFSLNSCGFVIL
jgi:hypothetical protein